MRQLGSGQQVHGVGDGAEPDRRKNVGSAIRRNVNIPINLELPCDRYPIPSAGIFHVSTSSEAEN